MAARYGKHEDTLSYQIKGHYLYGQRPCGGYVGGFYRRFRYPASPLSGGYMPKN
jgi:hypothetical protein